jgi:hypothetical protein
VKIFEEKLFILTIWTLFLQMFSKIMLSSFADAPRPQETTSFVTIFPKTWGMDGKIFEEKLFILTIWTMFLQMFIKTYCQRCQKSHFASWGVHFYSTFWNWGAILENITNFWSFIDLELNFKVFAVILLHFNANKMNPGSFNLKKKFLQIFFVVLYRNMPILRRKLRCDTAYFKPCV